MATNTLDVSDTKEDIARLLDHFGHNFLLTTTPTEAIINQTAFMAPSLHGGLHPKLNGASLVCAFKSKAQAGDSLLGICQSTALPRHPAAGVRLARNVKNNRVALAGGSYSATYAHCVDGKWRFVKQCKAYNHEDRDLRLFNEMEFIAGLPQEAKSLFPAILKRDVTDASITYETEYIPYPTFSEAIKSGNYGADYLADLLETVYESMFSVLYKDIPKVNPVDYVNTSRRRLREVCQRLPKGHFLRDCIEAEKLVINGKEYPGLDTTLSLADSALKDKPLPATQNHGDPIFQDILIDPQSKDFRLIDPNGKSSSYIYDFGKTLLCLETKYDLFYDGDFSLEIESKQPLSASITFTNDEHLGTIEAMRTHFWHYLEANQARFFKGLPEWRRILLLICGLQNIAIVMFHTDHKKYQRACGYLLSGIMMIDKGLKTE